MQDFYEAGTKHRKLTWIYSLGQCTMTAHFAARPVDLVLQGLQASTLLLFNDGEYLRTHIDCQPGTADFAARPADLLLQNLQTFVQFFDGEQQKASNGTESALVPTCRRTWLWTSSCSIALNVRNGVGSTVCMQELKQLQ